MKGRDGNGRDGSKNSGHGLAASKQNRHLGGGLSSPSASCLQCIATNSD